MNVTKRLVSRSLGIQLPPRRVCKVGFCGKPHLGQRHVRLRSSGKDGSSDNERQDITPGGQQPQRSDTSDTDKWDFASLWQEVKDQTKADLQKAALDNRLSAEQAKTVIDALDEAPLDSWSFLEASGKRMAAELLGPMLAELGVDEDPWAFFVDLSKLAISVQLLTCGAMFYGAELGGHLSTGDALRCVIGLAAGYFIRPFISMEVLFGPLYSMLLSSLLDEVDTRLVEGTPEAISRTVNKLGIIFAAAFFLPQVALGWSVHDCVQFAGPLALGLSLFDVCFIIAMLIKLRLL